MQVGIIGLGKMGANMTRRLLQHKHRVVAYDRDPKTVREAVRRGARKAGSLSDLLRQLKPPRIVWLMVPAGEVTASVLRSIEGLLQQGDIVIDGGNSNFRDSMARARDLAQAGIYFLDAGTSGGIWGLKEGYCLMVGGERKAFQRAQPLFRALAPKNGYAHVGPSGAGHFTKMVHNGIEYGMMQAYAEGFELMKVSEFGLDLHQVAALWGQGSVVRSWLLELAASALKQDPELKTLRDYVEDSGEGRWTIQEAVNSAVPATTLAHALFARFRSRQQESFAMKMVAALRREFGGHAVKKN